MANGKQKKSKKKIIIFSGIGALVVILIVGAIIGGSKSDIVAVQTEKVMRRNITQTVTATGTLNPEFSVVINPEVTGEIVDLPVKEGDYVKKGQLLIKIKPDLYLAQVEQSEANLKAAKYDMETKKAALDKVQSDYTRTQQLHEKGLASDSDLETAKSNYLSAKASYDGAQANILQMGAALKVQQDQLSKTTIYSPMDGIISSLNVQKGQRVLGSGYSQGTDVMTVSDLKSMQAVVDVNENDIVLVSKGDTARVKIDAFGDKVFDGIVTQIGNSAQTTGAGTQEQVVNFEVKINFVKFNPEFRPGMSCNASIETKTVHNVLSIPIQSVTARESMDNNSNKTVSGENQNSSSQTNIMAQPKQIVFVVKDGKAHSVNVTTGVSDDNYIEVKSGLKGDEDVVSGSYSAISKELHDGSDVRVESKKALYSEKK
jgi:HlyD family secretion protein